jgi:hypothetical protein
MQTPPRDPDVADIAPTDSVLTPYDHQHMVTYMRLLDADAEGADWREVARIVLCISILIVSPTAPGGHLRAISAAPSG